MAYKSRRDRKRAQGGRADEECPDQEERKRGGAAKKRKAGGHVEGAKAKGHLGKRARGGRTLDAREAANEPDGPDKVAEGRPEREVEMVTHKASGGGIHIKPSHKGLLHKDLGVKSGEPIPASKLEKAAHSSDPAERKRAVFAENAKKWNH